NCIEPSDDSQCPVAIEQRRSQIQSRPTDRVVVQLLVGTGYTQSTANCELDKVGKSSGDGMAKHTSEYFLYVIVSCLLTTNARAQGRPDFDLNVPNISPPSSPLGPTPIVHVRATVSVLSSAAVTFKITAPGSAVLSMTPATPGPGATPTALQVFPQTGCAAIAC